MTQHSDTTTGAITVWHDTTSDPEQPCWIVDYCDPRDESTTTLAVCESQKTAEALANRLRQADPLPRSMAAVVRFLGSDTAAAATLGRKGGAAGKGSPARRAAAQQAIRARWARYRYCLYRTAFHGGGLLSRHLTREAAEQAQRRAVGPTDCTCGCAVIVDRQVDPEPRPAAECADPYAPATR